MNTHVKQSAEPEYLYLNIYKRNNTYTISHYHKTRMEADEAAKNRSNRIACILVEFRDGQLDPNESFFLNINRFNNSYTLSQELYQDR